MAGVLSGNWCDCLSTQLLVNLRAVVHIRQDDGYWELVVSVPSEP